MNNKQNMGNPQMPQQKQGEGDRKPKGFMDTLAYYLGEKAPQLPKGFKEFMVKFAPWITILGLIMLAPLVLGVFGLSLSWGYYYFAGFSLMTSLLLVQAVLQIIALPGLFRRQVAGWNFSFYAVIVGFVANLMSYSGIVSVIVGTIIALYLLFQIRSYYN
jgi:hypothetical protein